MVRKQVYITEEQEEILKEIAAARGVTEASLLRDALDKYIAENRAAPPSSVVYEPQRERPVPMIREVAEVPYMAHSNDFSQVYSRMGAYQQAARHLDDDAWEEELRFIKELAQRRPEGGSTQQWRREDVYDKRRSRLPG